MDSLVSTRGTFSAGEQVTGMEMEIGIAGVQKLGATVTVISP